MKPSLTFILPILILVLSSCSSSPVVKNINYADNSQQLFIDSKINNQVAISDKDRQLLSDILNNLFLYKGLSDGDLITLESYIEKNYFFFKTKLAQRTSASPFAVIYLIPYESNNF